MHLLTVDRLLHYTSLLWFLLTAVWLGSLPFVKSTLRQQSSSSRVEQAAIFGLGLYLLFGAPGNPSWLNRQITPVNFPIALAGFGLVLFGIAFGIWARLTLGGNWSGIAVIKQDHTLIQTGPYRIVRHPIYTGLLVALLGTALQHGLARSFIAVLVCVVAISVKISIEEQFMLYQFGERYTHYRRHVKALVPFVF